MEEPSTFVPLAALVCDLVTSIILYFACAPSWTFRKGDHLGTLPSATRATEPRPLAGVAFQDDTTACQHRKSMARGLRLSEFAPAESSTGFL